MQALYRHYDKDDNLLYVGVSLNAINRLSQHKRNAHWFFKIDRVDIKYYETRKEVLEAEKKAIIEENPLYNIQRPKVQIVKEYKKPLEKAEESRNAIVSKIAYFNPVYELKEVCSILNIDKRTVENYIENGEMSCAYLNYTGGKLIEIDSEKKRIPVVKKKKVVTGWQLIDFIENLQLQTKDKLS